MCTLVILRRPEHEWPVIIGANRDEMIDRAAKPPGRHWPDRTEVVAGLDLFAGQIDDLRPRRLELALPAFRAWPAPDPDKGDWDAWQNLLGSTAAPAGEPASAAMRFRTDGYGTVSSALIALPAIAIAERRPIFRYAEWLPHETPWQQVSPKP